jgi:hypothetical protein
MGGRAGSRRQNTHHQLWTNPDSYVRNLTNATSVDDPFRCRGVAVFWTPGVITVAILSLCLFSYGIGLWHGQMQGLVIAKAGDQLEKPE